jgi:hypothetical protein
MIKPTILRFLLKATGDIRNVMSRFYPEGTYVLNRSEWMGKEPRSCAVTKVKGRPHMSGSNEPMVFDVEVSYRPKGWITFVGNTKYDGWTAMMLDQMKDGTLLDGHGKPLPDGQEKVYLPYEMFHDVEFSEIDFGEFVGETELGIKHFRHDEITKMAEKAGHVNWGTKGNFMAARRSRPLVKILLSNANSGTAADGFGTRIVMVNNSTPHLKKVLFDHLVEAVSGFIEGRYTLNSITTDEFCFVDLDHVLVDGTPNEKGGPSDFHCFTNYFPSEAIEELAQRLMATYKIDVSIVDWPQGGLLFEHEPKGKN